MPICIITKWHCTGPEVCRQVTQTSCRISYAIAIDDSFCLIYAKPDLIQFDLQCIELPSCSFDLNSTQHIQHILGQCNATRPMLPFNFFFKQHFFVIYRYTDWYLGESLHVQDILKIKILICKILVPCFLY